MIGKANTSMKTTKENNGTYNQNNTPQILPERKTYNGTYNENNTPQIHTNNTKKTHISQI